ncbi:MAG: 30S ribosomal protein S1 [Ignavibacteria bacterium]|nr:30S ribosomal protein S1 [Ignavibacteria bacterium]
MLLDKEKPQSAKQKATVSSLLEYGFGEFPIDDETYRKLSEKSVLNIKEDELVNGTITIITKDEVHVDIGFKSVGIVPRAELLNAELLKVGDQIDVYIEKIEDLNGRLLLSRRRADFMRIWEDIIKLYDKQEVVLVRILRRIKGGMVVDLLGIEAFLPGSQIDVRPIRDFDSWVAKTIDVKVVKVNHPSENVVVSHKVLLEEQLQEQRAAIVSKLEKGLVLEGTVKAIADFGVFVDLGGVDGLVHITDLSWGRVNKPSEVVELDQVVKVVILDFDPDKKRISLGMKQLTPHPWDTIGAKYDIGTNVQGKVVSLTDYGAFIEIEKGIEGLIHISEMSWTQHIKHPSQMVSMGQIVEAIVLNIDKDDKKLALGMKQLEPDPWADLMQKYPVDSQHNGIVRNLTNFGVFIELEPGVDGLVHISDLSWTKKIRHPGEFVKKGDEIDVVVLSIDPEQRRIALGHKQIIDNPWDYFEEKYKIGAYTEAKIERIIEKGVIVELPDEVDGFVPVSQLSFAPVKNISEFFQISDVLPLKVVEFDKESKKIVLSAVEALRDKEQADIDVYNTKHPVPNADKFVNETVSISDEEKSFFDSEFSSPTLADHLPKEQKIVPAIGSVEEEAKEEVSAEASPVVEETKEEEVKTEEVKTEEVKTEEVKTDEVKTEEVKTEEVKTDEVKTEEVKTEEVKTDEVKTDEVKTEEVKTEEVKEETQAENTEEA